MNQETATLIQAASGIFAILVAVVALLVALIVEWRTHRRFEEQLRREEELALASMKPLISVYPSKFADCKAITLCNHGPGTAIITSVEYERKGDRESQAITKMFKLPGNPVWDYYWVFRQPVYYLPPFEKRELVKLTAAGLAEDKLSERQILKLLDTMEEQMSGLRITIKYTDLLGRCQPDYDYCLP